MKALITGSRGFVGPYLREELEKNGYQVTGLDLQSDEMTIQADLLDTKAVQQVISQVKPDAIFHLAALADIGKSWKKPQLTMEMNIISAINLMEAVRNSDLKDTRIVMVGSADQYGNLGEAGASVSEDMEMKPQSPYAISKRAQEDMAKLYCKSYGMNICMTRSFNHSGAGQRLGFMIPDFAYGIVKVERGEAHEMLVGNLSSCRDFTHVRDTVRAYRLIAEKGHTGEVYNVGSGKTRAVQEILDQLRSMAKCEVPVRQDPSRMRPSDTPVIRCDHSKLTRDTGWEPEIDISVILEDTLNYYRSQPS